MNYNKTNTFDNYDNENYEEIENEEFDDAEISFHEKDEETFKVAVCSKEFLYCGIMGCLTTCN